jgi:hypothetical protein
VVTVAPGADNAFTPDPGDRMQPTAFKPGHWRFQCVMVMGPEFDGKLTWNLAYGGTKTSTSQNMLQSNWNLVEGAQDLAKIDYKNAKRGVCLNRAPAVRVLGSIRRDRENALAVTAEVGEAFSLFGSVNDEGLPRNAAMASTWKQISGPGAARFENANTPRTHVVFPAAGSYVLELSSTDSELSAATRVIVDVK